MTTLTALASLAALAALPFTIVLADGGQFLDFGHTTKLEASSERCKKSAFHARGYRQACSYIWFAPSPPYTAGYRLM